MDNDDIVVIRIQLRHVQAIHMLLLLVFRILIAATVLIHGVDAATVLSFLWK